MYLCKNCERPSPKKDVIQSTIIYTS